MVLLLHIASALVSMVLSAALWFRPSKVLFRTVSVLLVSTLATGTYLVWTTHSALLPACSMGLAYVVITASGMAYGRLKLLAAKVNSN